MSIYNENNSIVELEKLYLIDIDISTTDNVLTINNDGLITSTDVPFNTLASIAYVDEHTNITLQDAFDNSVIKEISVGSNPINIISDITDAPIITFGPNTTIKTNGISTASIISNDTLTKGFHILNPFTYKITIGLNPESTTVSTILLPGDTQTATSGYILKLANPTTGLTEWTDDGLAAITALINTKADISGESFNGSVEIYSNELMHNIFSANTATGDINVVGQFYLNYTQITATAAQINNIPNYLLKSGGTMTGILELDNDLLFNNSGYTCSFGTNTLSSDTSFILPNNQLSSLSGYRLSLLTPVTGETHWVSSDISGVINTVNQVSSFGSFLSSDIRIACLDRTGSGLLVFSDSPNFTGYATCSTAPVGDNSNKVASTAHVYASILASPSNSLQSLYQVSTPQITTSATYPKLGIRSASNSFNDKCLTISDSGNRETTSLNGNGSMIMNSYSDNNISYSGGISYQIYNGTTYYFGPTITAGTYTPIAFASLLNATLGPNNVTWAYARNFSYVCTGTLSISAIYFPVADIGFSSWSSGPSYSGTTVATLNTLTLNPTSTQINNITLTGVPICPTASTATNTTQIATTAFVKNQAYATLASPTFTGVPLAPTASTPTNSTQIATTAFVKNNLSSYLPLSGGTISGVLNTSTTFNCNGNLWCYAACTISSLNPFTDATTWIGNGSYRFLNFHCVNIYTSAITLGASLLTSIGNGLSLNSGALTGFVLNINQVVLNTNSGPHYPGVSWLDVPGMSILITPKTTSSRIMLDCSIVLSVNSTTTVAFKWVRYDSDTFLNQAIGVGSGGTHQGSFRSQTANSAWANTATHKYIDSPGKNIQLRYYLQYMTYDNTRAVYFNRSATGVAGDDVSCISTFTLTELAS